MGRAEQAERGAMVNRFVMPGLDTASRVYSTCGTCYFRTRASPSSVASIEKSASSKGVWIAGSEPRSWHRDRPQRPKVWTPDPNAANYWGAGAPEEMRK